jgi:hypothetical protein
MGGAPASGGTALLAPPPSTNLNPQAGGPTVDDLDVSRHLQVSEQVLLILLTLMGGIGTPRTLRGPVALVGTWARRTGGETNGG